MLVNRIESTQTVAAATPQPVAPEGQQAQGLPRIQDPEAARAAGQSLKPATTQAVLAEPRAQTIASPRALTALLKTTAPEAASLAKKLPEHKQGELLIRFSPGAAKAGSDDLLKLIGASVLHRFDTMGKGGSLVQVKLPSNISVAQAITALEKDGRVAYAEPNYIYKLDASAQPTLSAEMTDNLPDDLDPRLFGLHNTGQNGGTADADIDAPEAWAITTGSSDVRVAVIDTGADYNHPDLKDNMFTNAGEIPGDGVDNDGNGVIDDVHGYHALEDNGDPMDGHSHGSHVSGTIGAVGNNGQGVVGVNWDVEIMPVKIFSDAGRTDAAAIVRGIQYSTRMNARITSNSWGGGGFSQAIHDSFKDSPALHIMAAGNDGTNNDGRPHYPSNYDLPNIISVAATDRNDQIASFSNYGIESVDVGAPGVDTYSTTPGGNYRNMSGTSMATPHVSGLAALVVSRYPDISNEELKARIMFGADRIPGLQGKVVTEGRINAYNSLEEDAVPPADGSDFGSVSAAATQVTLAWTSPGDDGLEGRASYYEVRMSSTPIGDGPGQTPFGEAQRISSGTPSEAGTSQSIAVPMAPGSRRDVYFAVKFFDNVGNASGIQTTQVTVPPASAAFNDPDGVSKRWVAEGDWARVDAENRGQVWTDSPEGTYKSNSDASLAIKRLSLNGFEGSQLVFDTKFDIEKGYDGVHVEVAKAPFLPWKQPGDDDWVRVGTIDGKSDWTTKTFDLSEFDGDRVYIRFRLTSDGSVEGDGIQMDNVVVTGDFSRWQWFKDLFTAVPEEEVPAKN